MNREAFKRHYCHRARQFLRLVFCAAKSTDPAAKERFSQQAARHQRWMTRNDRRAFGQSTMLMPVVILNGTPATDKIKLIIPDYD